MARIRLEWGASVTYLWHPTQMPRIDWSGSLTVRGGRILGRERYRLDTFRYGPAREVRWAMNSNRWTSRPQNEIEGILVELEATRRTVLFVKFGWGSVKFRFSELEKALVLEWPVGPKYRFLTFRACLADVDPLDTGFADDCLPEACPPRPLIAVRAADFTDARCLQSYFRRETAWIEQLKETSARFRLASPRPLHLVLYLMLGSPYVQPPGTEQGANRMMRFEVLLNGRSFGVRETFFSELRGPQKVEEVHLPVAARLLRRGRNTVTVRNHDHCYHLLIVKAELHTKPLRDDFARVAPPAGYFCGFDTNTVAPENPDEFARMLRALADSRLANYVLFRPEGSLVHTDDFDRWIRICKAKGITFGYVWDETSYTRALQQKGGHLFLGQMFHEISDHPSIYAYSPVRRDGRPTMQTARTEYTAYVSRIVKRVKKASPRTRVIIGEANQFAALDYAGGADIVLAEVNTGHVGLLLAESRGAHRTVGGDFFGAHVAGGCIKFPVLQDAERLYQTTLHACYLHGVRLVYDEESALAEIHGKPYSFSSRFCRGRRALLARYNEFVSLHGHPGTPAVGLALVNGRFECPPPHGERVWNHFCGEDDTWKPGEPEAGWDLIDVLLPGVWKPPSPQNWKKLRFWHAGTPFGQFDIICSETSLRAMKQYRSIVFPGWNSMNRTLYRKLVSYVRSGGTLFMSLPQLSTRVDREFLEDAENPKLVNDGDLAELFGIRIPRKRLRGSARTAKVVFAAGNGLLPGGRTFRLSRPVACAGARLTTARPLARTASGQPVLVENRIGKGTARLLLTNEYPGASPLRKMMRNLLQALAVEAGPDVRVDDPAREVAWYLFEKDGVRHLWLHNTDWVIRGNVKTVTVREAGRVFQVDVKQGIPLRLVL